MRRPLGHHVLGHTAREPRDYPESRARETAADKFAFKTMDAARHPETVNANSGRRAEQQRLGLKIGTNEGRFLGGFLKVNDAESVNFHRVPNQILNLIEICRILWLPSDCCWTCCHQQLIRSSRPRKPSTARAVSVPLALHCMELAALEAICRKLPT
jgi:hypothetical protein